MAKQNHTSIHIDAATAAALDARRSGGETRTARLAADITAYHAMLDDGLRRARRALSSAEASLILDVCNGTAPGQTWTADRMTMRVADAIALDGMADKWGVDGDALVAKLPALGDLASFALADWADRVWGKGDFDISAETAIFKG